MMNLADEGFFFREASRALSKVVYLLFHHSILIVNLHNVIIVYWLEGQYSHKWLEEFEDTKGVIRIRKS
jgi:hypothetical protein